MDNPLKYFALAIGAFVVATFALMSDTQNSNGTSKPESTRAKPRKYAESKTPPLLIRHNRIGKGAIDRCRSASRSVSNAAVQAHTSMPNFHRYIRTVESFRSAANSAFSQVKITKSDKHRLKRWDDVLKQNSIWVVEQRHGAGEDYVIVSANYVIDVLNMLKKYE